MGKQEYNQLKVNRLPGHSLYTSDPKLWGMDMQDPKKSQVSGTAWYLSEQECQENGNSQENWSGRFLKAK